MKEENITPETLEAFLNEMTLRKCIPLESTRTHQLTHDINTAKQQVLQLKREIAVLNEKIGRWQVELDKLQNKRNVGGY